MRFATQADGTLDGALLLVSSNGERAMSAKSVAPNLIGFLQQWGSLYADMKSLAATLEDGSAAGIFDFDPDGLAAPLPRSPQWLDASAFLNHQRLMAQAFNTPLIPFYDTVPVLYQGASDDFLGPDADVPFADEAGGIDFEGEFGVIVDEVPMGVTPEAALDCIRLVVQINDWSLRALGAREVKSGFGFIQAKPSSSFAPIAVTLDELGPLWREGRLDLDLHVAWNGAWFGHANGMEMHYHFGELIAYAAKTRKLTAGTIVGSGTVSNEGRTAGSSCVAERRVIEIIDNGAATTNFMKFGDVVRMEARPAGGGAAPFGAIEQYVVPNAINPE